MLSPAAWSCTTPPTVPEALHGRCWRSRSEHLCWFHAEVCHNFKKKKKFNSSTLVWLLPKRKGKEVFCENLLGNESVVTDSKQLKYKNKQTSRTWHLILLFFLSMPLYCASKLLQVRAIEKKVSEACRVLSLQDYPNNQCNIWLLLQMLVCVTHA